MTPPLPRNALADLLVRSGRPRRAAKSHVCDLCQFTISEGTLYLQAHDSGGRRGHVACAEKVSGLRVGDVRGQMDLLEMELKGRKEERA